MKPTEAHLNNPVAGGWWAYGEDKDLDTARDLAQGLVVDSFGLQPHRPSILSATGEPVVIGEMPELAIPTLMRACLELPHVPAGESRALPVSFDREWGRRRVPFTLEQRDLALTEIDTTYGRVSPTLLESILSTGVVLTSGEVAERVIWRSIRGRARSEQVRSTGDRGRVWTVRDSKGALLAEELTASAARRRAVELSKDLIRRKAPSGDLVSAHALLSAQGEFRLEVQAEARRGGACDTFVRIERTSLVVRGVLLAAERKERYLGTPPKTQGWLFFGRE